jgi:hypothetical protein
MFSGFQSVATTPAILSSLMWLRVVDKPCKVRAAYLFSAHAMVMIQTRDGAFPLRWNRGHCRRMAGGRKDARCAPYRSDQRHSTSVIRSPGGNIRVTIGFSARSIEGDDDFRSPTPQSPPAGGEEMSAANVLCPLPTGGGEGVGDLDREPGSETEILSAMGIQWRRQLSLCKRPRLCSGGIVVHCGCKYPMARRGKVRTKSRSDRPHL